MSRAVHVAWAFFYLFFKMVNRKKKNRGTAVGPTILSTGFTVTLNFQFFFLFLSSFLSSIFL
jgi:hypothetical protein